MGCGFLGRTAVNEIHTMANATATDTAGLQTHAGKTMIGENWGILFYQVIKSLRPRDITDLSDVLGDILVARIASIIV
jgi:hypothetical protein